jgi:hypothetical protein
MGGQRSFGVRQDEEFVKGCVKSIRTDEDVRPTKDRRQKRHRQECLCHRREAENTGGETGRNACPTEEKN